MLGGDVGVFHLIRLGLGGVEGDLGLACETRLGGAVHGGEVVKPFLKLRPHGSVPHADALEYRDGQPAVLVQQSGGEMLGLYLGVPTFLRQLLGGRQRFLGLQCETFQLHVYQRSSPLDGSRFPGRVPSS